MSHSELFPRRFRSPEREIREAAREAVNERDEERKQTENEIREAARKAAQQTGKSKKGK